MKQKLTEKIKNLPTSFGVYQFFDINKKLLYVGKAKNLKNRVHSYFHKITYENRKKTVLVKKIADIKIILVNTEYDALFLENSLIKKHQPPYNIQLKDDKTFPWICIKNEPFPRIFYTRNPIKDNSEYFGPYASVKVMKNILELIQKTYKIRSCNFHLSKKNIAIRKFKICLDYQIGNCKGPCENKQTEEEYKDSIQQVRDILKGNIKNVILICKQNMIRHAKNLEFELAQEMKIKLNLLEKYQAKSTIVNPKIHNVDVFSVITMEKIGYVNYMKINNGSIILSHTLEIKKNIDESDSYILEQGIIELINLYKSQAKEIYTSIKVCFKIENKNISQPKIGDKKKLIDLSIQNLKYYIKDNTNLSYNIKPHKRILEQIKKDLKLNQIPTHIECFDNSNIQGTTPVAACVVFKNTKPSKKDYRHFNIKTVKGPNDFDSMTEVVYRRYKRMLDEKKSLPQLIIIDGGKGQLSAAIKALQKLELFDKIQIISIAKRLEEIFIPNNSIPLYLDKRSETLKIIQQLRNEAHRFGITHHRTKRNKESLTSELSKIKGIGNKTVEELLIKFHSVEKIKALPINKLIDTIGLKKTTLIKQYFKLK